MDIESLRKRFPLPDLLTFEDSNGLTRLQVHTPQATATIFLQGAHLTAWQPTGAQPVIFLSRKSDFPANRFAAASQSHSRGSRPTASPTASTAIPARHTASPASGLGHAAHHTGQDLSSRSIWTPTTSAAHSASTLSSEDGVHHRPLPDAAHDRHQHRRQAAQFEEAFHSYYAVTDIHEVTVTGLEPTRYIDKTDNMKRKPAANAPLHVHEVHRPRLQQHHRHMRDSRRRGKRRIVIRKENSNTTVVWNPWKKLPDLGAMGVARDGRRRNREHGGERRHARSRREPHHACDHLRREKLALNAGFA